MDITRKEKILHIYLTILMIVILILPKINIISVPGIRIGIRIEDIMIAIYAFILLYRLIKKKIKINKQIKTILVLFSIYIAISFISTIVNYIVGQVGLRLSMLYVIRKIEYFILFFAGIDFFNTTNNKKCILNLLNAVVVFHIIYSFLEYANIIGDIGHLIGRANNDRIYTTFSGPYEFSAFFSMMSCIYIIKILKDKNYIYIPLLIISVVEILISQSRISLLAVLGVFALALLYYMKDKQKRIKVISLLVVSCIIFLLFVQFSNINFLKRFKDIDLLGSLNTVKIAWNNGDYQYYKDTGEIKVSAEASMSSTDSSFVFRISKWATLLKETLESNILLGIGPSIVGEGIDGNYTRIICETGVLGIFVWITILIYILKQTYRDKNNINKEYSFFILINLCIIAIFIDIFEASKIMCVYWFILGISLIDTNSFKENNKIKIMHVLSGVNFRRSRKCYI